MIKILVDEDMPRPTADLLRSLNIDAFDVREIGLRGATDQEIFKYAQKKGMIIEIRPLIFETIIKSHAVRRASGLMVNDSVIIASMKKEGVKLLATNDKAFKKVDEVDVYSPGDLKLS